MTPTASAPRVLVVGEALVDVFPARSGEGSRSADEPAQDRRVPGGSPANMALGLARLGVPVALLTHLGDDEDGRLVRDHLAAVGVDVLPGSFVAGRTSTAVATVDDAGVPTYEFDVTWDLPDVTQLTIPDAVHVGSYAAFLEPGATRVAGIAARARGAGALVSLDPNIRPALVPALDAVRERFEQLAGDATVVKLSDEDAAFLYPDLSDERVVEHVLSLGPRLVALTLGAEGSIVADHARSVRVPAADVPVVDTVGAGDSYMAALLDSLLRTHAGSAGPGGAPLDLERIGRRSSTAAGITVGRRGAELPTSADLDGH